MRYITLLIVMAAGLSCGSRSASGPAESRALKVQEGQVISRIVGKHQVIVVRAGSNDGPTYSIESKNGNVLIAGMTIDQLATNHPELHRAIQTMHADADADADALATGRTDTTAYRIADLECSEAPDRSR